MVQDFVHPQYFHFSGGFGQSRFGSSARRLVRNQHGSVFGLVAEWAGAKKGPLLSFLLIPPLKGYPQKRLTNTHTNRQASTQTHKHTTHTHTQKHTNTQTQTHMHTNTQPRKHTNTHTQAHKHTSPQTHKDTHTHTNHTQVRKHADTRRHTTTTHTHTHTSVFRLLPFPPVKLALRIFPGRGKLATFPPTRLPFFGFRKLSGKPHVGLEMHVGTSGKETPGKLQTTIQTTISMLTSDYSPPPSRNYHNSGALLLSGASFFPGRLR